MLNDESTLDTAVDLYVYALKYELYLMEQDGSDSSRLPIDAPKPVSDHDANFEILVDADEFEAVEPSSFSTQVAAVADEFEHIWKKVDDGASLPDRQAWASRLTGNARAILATVAHSDSQALRAFLRTEQRLADLKA
jgi:thymidylate synthase